LLNSDRPVCACCRSMCKILSRKADGRGRQQGAICSQSRCNISSKKADCREGLVSGRQYCSNVQWETIEEAKAKDREERKQ